MKRTSWVWDALRQLAQASGGVDALGADLRSERPLIPVRRYKLTGRPSDGWVADMRDALTDAVGFDGRVFSGPGYLEAFLGEDEDMTLVYELRWPRGR